LLLVGSFSVKDRKILQELFNMHLLGRLTNFAHMMILSALSLLLAIIKVKSGHYKSAQTETNGTGLESLVCNHAK
jgi:hypothetical protein